MTYHPHTIPGEDYPFRPNELPGEAFALQCQRFDLWFEAFGERSDCIYDATEKLEHEGYTYDLCGECKGEFLRRGGEEE